MTSSNIPSNARERTVTGRTFVDQLPSKLHLGEREALALAREHSGVVLVDEREARRAAQQHGIGHFGSLRVLKEAKDRGLLREIKPILDELIARASGAQFAFPSLLRHACCMLIVADAGPFPVHCAS